MTAPASPQKPVAAVLTPFPQQIDMDGQLHDLAPQTRQEKLFIPAPAQLPGQEVMPELS